VLFCEDGFCDFGGNWQKIFFVTVGAGMFVDGGR
jgi:hypothetical protein